MLSFLILLGAVLAVGILFFQVVEPFLFPLFFAGVLAILFRPAYERAVALCRGHDRIAAALTTVLLLMLVLLPLGGGLALGGRELFLFGVRFVEEQRPKHDPELVDRMQEIGHEMAGRRERWSQLMTALESLGDSGQPQPEVDPQVQTYVDELRSRFPDEALARYAEPPSLLTLFDLQRIPLVSKALKFAENQLSDEQRRALRQTAFQSLQAVSGQIYNSTIALAANLLTFLVGLFIVALSLYYFFADGPQILSNVQRVVPLAPEYQEELYKQFETICRAVVAATLASAFVQGLLGGAAYYLAGLSWVWLLMLLTMFCAMIPVGGAALVWLPASIWLLLQQRYLAGILLAVFGTGGISGVDNLIKPYVIQGRAKLHPLLVFVSVLGALRVIGLWGIFIGPMVAAVFYSLLRILHTELNRDRGPDLLTAATPEGPTVEVPPPPVEVAPVGGKTAATQKPDDEEKSGKDEAKEPQPEATQAEARSKEKK